MTRDNEQPQSTKGQPRRCPGCGKRKLAPALISHTSEIKHEGSVHTVTVADVPVLKCEGCGEIVFGVDADRKIYSALREQLGLYQPETIRQKRQDLNLTQKEFAEDLGIASETVSRWESGLQIQSRAMNNLLRLYFDLPDVRTTLGAFIY